MPHLPDCEFPYDCSYSESEEYRPHKCLLWQNGAQLFIYYESKKMNEAIAECHSIRWQELENFS